MRKFSPLHYVMFLLVISLMIPQSVGAQSEPKAILVADKEIVSVGLDLTQQSLDDASYDAAAGYAKMTSEFFAQSLQTVRPLNTDLVDEIHITLVDIQTDANSRLSSSIISEKIAHVKSLLNQIKPNDSQTPDVLINMLAAADQRYQEAISDKNELSYNFSHSIIVRSEQIFASTTSFDQNQYSELKLYFSRLDSQITNKEAFVAVGNTITSIQNNILGIKTHLNKNNLYDVIRQLYKELEADIDSGNYQRAEDLSITAYLENFEYLEPGLLAVDKSLEHKLEILMREDLRKAISEHQPTQVIKEKLSAILSDLDKAEKLVSDVPSSQSTVGISKDSKRLPMGSASDSQKAGIRGDLDSIRDNLQTVLVQYKEGNYEQAYVTARSAYLDSYEHVEIPLRVINPDFTSEVEMQFAQLRNLINEKADYAKVEQATIAIKRNLDESERQVSGTGALAPTIAFSSSFALIFREGLESVLILGAILTYLDASRNARFKPYVYYGALAAIVATAVTWFLASYVIEISGANRELVAAVAALSATAVLFYVSFWILNKIETKKWIEFVKAKVWQASITGGFTVFVLLSFFTVYREGFETVLFYQAMFGFAKYMEAYVALGFVLGMATLLSIYYGMRRLGKRLPLRWLFGLTMGVGAYLSVAFIGNAIRQLQILDMVHTTNMIGTIPRLDINLSTMTGIHPTLETLVAQVILLAVYLVAGLYVLVIKPKKAEQISNLRKSRAQIETSKS